MKRQGIYTCIRTGRDMLWWHTRTSERLNRFSYSWRLNICSSYVYSIARRFKAFMYTHANIYMYILYAIYYIQHNHFQSVRCALNARMVKDNVFVLMYAIPLVVIKDDNDDDENGWWFYTLSILFLCIYWYNA